MKITHTLILGAVTIMFITACSTASRVAGTSTPVTNPPVHDPFRASPAPSMELIFHDEFNSDQLNTSLWSTEHWWGRTNPPELEYYTSDALRSDNGTLSIIGDKRARGGMDYTSGIVTTINSFSFTYGYAEIRARIPSGQGLWPAFWLTNDNGRKDKAWSEIDVFEFLCQQPNVLYMTLHYTDEQQKSRQIGTHIEGPDFSRDFHTYAVDWSPQAVIWYIDGVEQFRVTEHVPNGAMYVIANLQIGGNWPGSPDQTTAFPAHYDIDYIRVYQVAR